MEIWKAVVGYESRYTVSNLGKVVNIQTRRRMTAFLTDANTQYWAVTLSLEGSGRRHLIHHLVLEAFVGPRPAGLKGLHKDDNKSNNRLENLYWGTSSENIADSLRNGKHAVGTRSPQSKLTDDKVIEMRRLHSLGWSCCHLAKEFGVSHVTAARICLNRGWKHLIKAEGLEQ